MSQTSDPKELGTLIIVVSKARNLVNKARFGKQDPYCAIDLNGKVERTKAVKRGGQRPEWDEEFRFVIHEDVDDVLARSESTSDGSLSISSRKDAVAATANGLPPSTPPKDGSSGGGRTPAQAVGVTTAAALASKSRKGPLGHQRKGQKTLKVACYADDNKEPELIGECVVGIDLAIQKGEVDEWYDLLDQKDKYVGEIYLELTFYSNAAPPVKRNVPRPMAHYPTAAGFPDGSGRLPTSGSLTGASLYVPPYAPNAPLRGSTPAPSQVPSSNGSFADLGLPPGHSRNNSLPSPAHAAYASSMSNAAVASAYDAAIDVLSRPMSSMSISSSVSSRPLPSALPTSSFAGIASSSGYAAPHRHSVGGHVDAPWYAAGQQAQTQSGPAPHQRPLSTNSVAPWDHIRRMEDERALNTATPIARPTSSAAYSQTPPPSHSLSPPQPDTGGYPRHHHAHSFSGSSRPDQASYRQPSPSPYSAPPVQPASSLAHCHYPVPSSSFANLQRPQVQSHESAPLPPPRQPSPAPLPVHAASYSGSMSSQPAFPDYNAQTTVQYQATPPQGHPYSSQSQGQYDSPQPGPSHYGGPSPQPQSEHQQQAYDYANGGQPTPPPPPRRQSVPVPPGTDAKTESGGYVPWYQQTQPRAPAPPAQDQHGPPASSYSHQAPPPIPSYRPVPNPPAPPKTTSVGYYPSDELYAEQRQQEEAARYRAQQPQQQTPGHEHYATTYGQPAPQVYRSPSPAPPPAAPPAQYPGYPPQRTPSPLPPPSVGYTRSPSPLPAPPTTMSAAPQADWSGAPAGPYGVGGTDALSQLAAQMRTTSPAVHLPPAPPPPQPQSLSSSGSAPIGGGPVSQARQDWRAYMQSIGGSGTHQALPPQPPVTSPSPQLPAPPAPGAGDWRASLAPQPSLPPSMRSPEGWQSTVPDGPQSWRG